MQTIIITVESTGIGKSILERYHESTGYSQGLKHDLLSSSCVRDNFIWIQRSRRLSCFRSNVTAFCIAKTFYTYCSVTAPIKHYLVSYEAKRLLDIMLKQPTPERAIDIVWFSVASSFCWPLSTCSSRTQILVYKILQIISVINACVLLLALLYSVYVHSDDIIIVFESICLVLAVSQFMVQIIICSVNYKSLQRVIEEMINYIKEAQQYEQEIFCKHIAKCSVFYGSSMGCMYLTAAAFSLGPTVLPVSFPCEAEYPFRVNYTPANVIIYMHQSIVSFQCAAHMCVSIFGASLLWYTAARFECLAIELKETTNIPTLIVCIKKQLHLRRYAEEVINNFRFVVLCAIVISTIVLTLCGVTLIMDSPLIVKMRFIVICLTVLTEIYIYAWPADYMKDMVNCVLPLIGKESMHVSRSAYDLIWYKQTLTMQKNLLNVLGYQTPVTFSISFIIPDLSLRYYCSYLSNVFSIFTALRAVVNDK